MKNVIEKHSCDLCGKPLKTHQNELDIVTEIQEENPWSRIHVKINNQHGFHNDYKTEPAELCKNCTVKLLTDALKRVKKGERATAGSQSIEMKRW